MIDLSFLGPQPVAVFGLGKTGLATIHALQAAGIPYLAWDDNETTRGKTAALGITLTPLNATSLATCQALVWSPGIPHTLPQPHPVAEIAKQLNIPMLTDLDLLYRAQPQAKYIGITGTNGKSTTTALIAHILKTAGKQVEVGGNLGYPALSLAPLGADGIYVLELSSYQTELMVDLRCDIAVWLNLTPDHLERHGDTAHYAAAKARIFQPRDANSSAIIGDGDEYSRAQIAELQKQGRPITILSAATPNAGNPNKQITYNAKSVTIGNQHFDLSQAPALPGFHNGQNAAAAVAVCRALGLTTVEITKGINSYASLPHRQQRVAQHRQVAFVNDSKATNPEAAAKALACYDRIYWIIGGRPTSDGLHGLESFVPRLRHAFIIGEASAEFAAWCAAQNLSYTLCETLAKAVPAAAQMALADPATSTVLLSPACKSWDQFPSYEARGELFTQLAQNVI